MLGASTRLGCLGMARNIAHCRINVSFITAPNVHHQTTVYVACEFSSSEGIRVYLRTAFKRRGLSFVGDMLSYMLTAGFFLNAQHPPFGMERLRGKTSGREYRCRSSNCPRSVGQLAAAVY